MSVILLDAHAFTPPIVLDGDGDDIATMALRSHILGAPAVARATFVGLYNRSTGGGYILKDRWGPRRAVTLRELLTLARDRLNSHLEADFANDPDAR